MGWLDVKSWQFKPINQAMTLTGGFDLSTEERIRELEKKVSELQRIVNQLRELIK